MRTVFRNVNLITPYRQINDGMLIVDDCKIIAVIEDHGYAPNPDDVIIDSKGFYLSPGFIDTHTHGAGNSDFMDGSIEAVLTACRTHLKYGTTSIIPTTLTSTNEELFSNLERIEQAAKIDEEMPNIIGIHLEGPYFALSQKGAQDPRYLRNPDPREYSEIFERCPSIIRWTVAPELPGALEMGRWMRNNGIVPAIGHSNAEYSDVIKAVENGYTLVTHLFNGMSRLTRRDALMYLGVAESALLIDQLNVEIIADGKHLPPNLLKLIYKVKGPDRICLVTDSIRAAGVQVSESILGSLNNGQRVIIEEGVAYMPDKNSFGGSIATTNRLVRVMVKEVDVPIQDAIKMITITPAKIHNIDQHKGSLTIGKDADIVIFDSDLNVHFVMVKGKICLNHIEQ